MPKREYRVFVSHAGADLWVAEQIAKAVESCGAETFLDRRDIAAGDNFRRRIRQEMPKCDELLALFTPWSRRRAWVRHEIGMADMLNKRIVCVSSVATNSTTGFGKPSVMRTTPRTRKSEALFRQAIPREVKDVRASTIDHRHATPSDVSHLGVGGD
jgi:hypothetical protein